MPILVTYSSRLGATAGVAGAIGETLRAHGAEVDILPMDQVSDIRPYQSVIAGSAIQSARWLPEAVEFIRKNQSQIAERPFAMFSVCMTLAMPNGEKYRQGIREWMQPVRDLVKPVSEEIFAGSLHVKKVPGFGPRLRFRISVALGVWKEGDHRDWKKIRKWAEEVGEAVHSGGVINQHPGETRVIFIPEKPE
jgi:menaquinone-dependent protoporphyrinogen oxidase